MQMLKAGKRRPIFLRAAHQLAQFCEKAAAWVVRRSGAREWALISLAPEGAPKGRVLVSNQIQAFLPELRGRFIGRHNQYNEAEAMAETLLEMGYAVDLVAAQRLHPVRGRHYDAMISHRDNFERLATGLPRGCLRIAYLDTTHWTFNNHASLGRSLDVETARGITPEKNITVPPNRAIENAHCAILMAHEQGYETYAFAGKPVYEIVNLATTEHPRPADKDIDACRRRFIWFGSRGLAHKGLGITLEAFARMPEMHLTVCGPLDREPEFCRAYRHELQDCRNIEVLGWVDPAGPDFTALAARTLGLVYPSCAEAQSGAVLNCMQAGFIPIISRQTNVRIDPSMGVELAANGVEEVIAAVRELAARPAGDLQAMALNSWDLIARRHSRAAYKRHLRRVLEDIFARYPDLPAPGFIPLPPLRPASPTADSALPLAAG